MSDMNEYDVDVLSEPDLRDPVLVEGLPGVGHVGTLVAEHLIEEGDSELVRRVYSEHLPPQVSVGDDGVAELTHTAFHAVDVGENDLVVVTGDHQAQTNAGHYRLTDAFLDVAEDFDIERIYALGGVPTGELIEEYDVLSAVSDADLREEIESAGALFRENEPAGGIVGISGLLLGLGARRDFEVACLMGETSGYLVDPKSAKAVLTVLQDLVGFEVDVAALDDRADEMEEVVGKIREMEQQAVAAPSDEDLRYIG